MAGYLEIEPLAREEARATLKRMSAVLAHRGPDDEGFWLEPASGIALCHRRLSIVDLSPLGHQPMSSVSGRFTLTFNGEIYNYRELRAELLAFGHGFRGSSDTEVLLAALEEWGLEATLGRCRGMFAFALWDKRERTLHLVRDRFGEKPLYYGAFRGCFVFGSELKALREHPAWRSDVDRDALALLLRHDFIPAPHSIFRHARKVRPGCILTVRAEGSSFATSERPFWKPAAIRANHGEPSELVERVHDALAEAIRLQMVADVPVGAFLSGGIDSSLIVAMMQRASARAVRTFSIGFTEEEYDESAFARRIARHLGTEHEELIVTPEEARAVIPRLPQIYDEPFADSSQIPTFLVSQLARRRVTVSLSGDAGDELFGGYGRYHEARERWQSVRRIPKPLRAAARQLLARMPHASLELAARPLAWASRLTGRTSVAERVLERAPMWTARSLPELYAAMNSYWQPTDQVVLGSREPDTVASRRSAWPPDVHEMAHMMYVDTCLYLPEDILVKVDRAAMAVSLETRIPLLDPNVAEAAWQIPVSVHASDGRGKWVLRVLLQRYVPPALFERPKKGFGVPIGRWLRRELREWAGDLLESGRLRREGYLSAARIERRWQQHQSGAADWTSHLWGVLMFQAWLEEQRRADARTLAQRRHAAGEVHVAPV